VELVRELSGIAVVPVREFILPNRASHLSLSRPECTRKLNTEKSEKWCAFFVSMKHFVKNLISI
jgi:hypothetical protein